MNLVSKYINFMLEQNEKKLFFYFLRVYILLIYLTDIFNSLDLAMANMKTNQIIFDFRINRCGSNLKKCRWRITANHQSLLTYYFLQLEEIIYMNMDLS